jgi:DNA-binding beta-propeller fold protein YncE
MARPPNVASWRGGTVTPIATATNTAGTPIEVGEGARAIVITPDGTTAYVGVWGEPGTVVPIATATNTPGPPIPVGDGPYAIAITP